MRYGFAHDDAEYDDADDGSDVESLQLAEAMDLLETRYAAHLAGKDYALALQHAQLIIDILHAASVSVGRPLALLHDMIA